MKRSGLGWSTDVIEQGQSTDTHGHAEREAAGSSSESAQRAEVRLAVLVRRFFPGSYTA